MNTLLAFIVLASINNTSVVQTIRSADPPTLSHPFSEGAPKPSEGLTLYNAKGEVVAKCGKKEDSFANCKMEPGVTLDDLMNAWVHAYEAAQK